MSFSAGSRSAFTEAASWVVAGVCIVSSFIYFDELKSLMAHTMGLKPPAEMARQMSAPPTRGPVVANHSTPTHQVSSGSHVELSAGPYGHFHAEAVINGYSINVLVDTGATTVALSADDAERAGIYVTPADFKYTTQTANGVARMEMVMLDRVSIGDIELRNVQASVAERGALSTTLLGMSFIGRLRRAEMQSGRLILEN